jgi:sialidase-1
MIFWACIISLICLTIASGSAPDDATKVFVKGEGGYFCHKIPTLFSTTDNVLLAFAEARGKNGREACDDFSGTDLVYKRSFDGGVTWGELTLFYTNSSESETNVVGNAAPVQDRDSGRIWLPFCRNNEEIWISHSDDGGLTWALPSSLSGLVQPSWLWVGLGPPGAIQLQSGRLLVPAYHSTSRFKGDGCWSAGFTMYSDDAGVSWQVSGDFGTPFKANECQAVELANGDVLIAARTISTHRIQVTSHDGGVTFDAPYVVPKDSLQQTIEGCEGSIVRDAAGSSDAAPNVLYFSNPNNDLVIRRNMTIFKSIDDGQSWDVFREVDRGAVAYSSLQMFPTAALAGGVKRKLLILYERSNSMEVVFEPDEIVLWAIDLLG